MTLRTWTAGGLFTLISFVALASAQAEETLPAELLIGVGALNPLGDEEGSQWMGVLDYRFAEFKWNVRPWLGVAHAEKGTTFASAGLLYTLPLENGLRFSVGWAPTYYDAHDGRRLGSKLDFYSFVEAGYAFKNNQVVSARFGHLSNGGFEKRNPGTETLQLSYSLPLP